MHRSSSPNREIVAEAGTTIKDSLPTVLLALPLPPPYSGLEAVTEMLLASSLSERFQIVHLDTSNKASNVNRGRVDWQNSYMTVRNIMRLFGMLARYRPHLIVVTIPKNRMGFIKFASFVLLSALARTPVIARSGGGHFDKFYEGESLWMQIFIRNVLHHVNTVIVEADRLKQPFIPFFPPERIRTAYLGLDVGMFDGFLSSTTSPNPVLNILYVGHISKAKGAVDLLQAASKVLQFHPNVRFQFAGNILQKERNITFIDNPEDNESEILRLVDSPTLKRSVELLGIISGEQKLRTIAQAGIFVLPSYSEGFPVAVLEAMLAGKAVIATPVGALPEVFEDEKHLLFVEPGNVEAIANALDRLIRNPQLRSSLGMAARKIVQDRFNLNVLADRMEEIFLSVINQ